MIARTELDQHYGRLELLKAPSFDTLRQSVSRLSLAEESDVSGFDAGERAACEDEELKFAKTVSVLQSIQQKNLRIVEELLRDDTQHARPLKRELLNALFLQ